MALRGHTHASPNPPSGYIPRNVLSPEDVLQIQFELFTVPLLQAEAGSNIMFDIGNLIPSNPVFDVVAVQRLQIQNMDLSDYHEYFPVQ
jgi:hypothetical protein